MLGVNEKFTLLKVVNNKDQFGSIIQDVENLGDFWCMVVESDGFFKDIKGGKKRVQTITVRTWLNRDIDHNYMVLYNGVRYNVLCATHSRVRGTTTIQCEFNN